MFDVKRARLELLELRYSGQGYDRIPVKFDYLESLYDEIEKLQLERKAISAAIHLGEIKMLNPESHLRNIKTVLKEELKDVDSSSN